MAQAFTVEFDFGDGAGWENVSLLTRMKEFYRERYIYNALTPTVDSCRFRMKYDQNILSKILLASGDIKARIFDQDSSDYFFGFVNPNYKIKSKTRVEWIEIRLIDNNYILEKRIASNLQYADIKLMDYTDPSNSLVHKILLDSGATAAEIGNVIAYESDGITPIAIPYFTHLKEQPNSENAALRDIPYGGTYQQVLTDILFQYGFTYYFDQHGELRLFDFKNTNVEPGVGARFDNTNMIGALDFDKKRPRYEAVEIAWQEEELLTDQILFKDTTGQNSIYEHCNIPISAGEYYPPNATSSFIPEGYYNPNFSDGRDATDIIAVYNASLEAEYEGEEVETTTTVTTTVTNTYTRRVPVFDWKSESVVYECHDPVTSIITAGRKIFTNTKYQEISNVGGCWTGCFNYSIYQRFGFRDWRWVEYTACPIPGFKWKFETFVYTVVRYDTEEYTEDEEVSTDVTNTTITDPAYTQDFETLPLSFKLRIKNNSTEHLLNIRKLQITGDVRMKGIPSTTRVELSGATDRTFSYAADYLHTQDETSKLANAIYDYYRHSTYKYQLQSHTLYEPGEWVYITDNNFLNVNGFPVENKRCLIVSRKDEEFSETHTYILEEYRDYVSP